MKPSDKVEKRGIRKRSRNPIFLFAVEGNNKTERIYLENFRKRQGFQIQFSSGNYTDPVKMMKRLKDDAKSLGLSHKDGDRAFCMIDTDAEPEKSGQIYTAAEMENDLLRVITSSPCFEEWFLCHFRKSTKYHTNQDAVAELKKYIPDYSKNRNVYDNIKDNTQTAIDNAKYLEKYHKDQGRDPHSVECNPSSEVYKVIEMLLK